VNAIPAALAAPNGDPGPPTRGCDQADENDGDPYDSTCDGSASENGQGGGNANGKPCAGCVGAADNKNPQGQFPNGTDPNKGYECDENKGVGVGNPAHTSCDVYSGGQPSGEAKKVNGSVTSFETQGSTTPAEERTGLTGAMLIVVALLTAVVFGGTRVLSSRVRTDEKE
jgi:hypothetical protein